MLTGLISTLVLLVRPDAMGAEALLAAGLLVAALAVFAVLRATAAPAGAPVALATDQFPTLRVLLRASDPAAAGHRRARAPGTIR